MARKYDPYSPLKKNYPYSQRVNSVSIGAEMLFVRLVAQADDAGHYWADPTLVLGNLFAIRWRAREVTEKKVTAWLAELVSTGLILLYESGGERYLEIANPLIILRSDVTPKYRFPQPVAGQVQTVPLVPESGPATARGCPGGGPLNQTKPNQTTPTTTTARQKVAAKRHKVEGLIALYRMVIAPRYKGGADRSGGRGRKNIGDYLGQHAYADLLAAVMNYREEIMLEKKQPRYRKAVANFFGKDDPRFTEYLPSVYTRPTPAKQKRAQPTGFIPSVGQESEQQAQERAEREWQELPRAEKRQLQLAELKISNAVTPGIAMTTAQMKWKTKRRQELLAEAEAAPAAGEGT